MLRSRLVSGQPGLLVMDNRIDPPALACIATSGNFSCAVGFGNGARPLLRAPRNNTLMATILPVQCWMARAALGWSKQKLGKVAGVAGGTVARLEAGAALKASTVEAIQLALEKAGVVFIGEDDGGPGARLSR